MILDNLANAACYYDVHPRFQDAFDFLHHTDLPTLPPGRHDIDGDRLFVIIDQSAGRGRGGAVLEAHRKYIDIQLSIAGDEEIGWKARQLCSDITTPYDDEKDIMFFGDVPHLWLPLPPGNFVVLLTEDAHAPLAGVGMLHKAVVKVAVKA